MRRALWGLAVGVGLAAATLSTTWALLFHRPAPTIDGYYRLVGLHERAEVVRDVFGIPRIYARDLHDLFFLQGYVTAQDRFAQMDALRRSAAAVSVPVPSEIVRDALVAYSSGVNKFVSHHADARALPAEIVLAGRAPAPWTVDDSLRIGSLLRTPTSKCISVPRDLAMNGQRLLAAEIGFPGDAPGWYEIGLSGGEARGIGISLPGLPGIVAGHNAWVAWAPTWATPPERAVGIAVRALVARGTPELGPTSGLCGGDLHGAQLGTDLIAATGRFDLEALRTSLGPPASAVGARLLIDLADVDTSRSAVSHGASAHRSSSHYDDQAPLWKVGQTHRLPFTRGAVGRTDGELVFRAR